MDSITISRMDCYAGKWRSEVLHHSPDIHNEPGVYLQFVEGCGYNVFNLTPEEAEAIAAKLIEAAKKTREAFKK